MQHIFKYIKAVSAFALLASCTNNAVIEPPLVYDVENSGAKFDAPVFLPFEQLPEVHTLTNPFEWSDGSGCLTRFEEWERRRNEIAHEIQHYEIGTKPAVDASQVCARLTKGEKSDTLFVTVARGDSSLTIWSEITYPSIGEPPYALMIGTSHNSLPHDIFRNRPIALMTFHERQVNGYSQFRGDTERSNYGFVHLYPELIDNGAYSEWAWGLSRLIDGLQQLGPEETLIDTRHIGVTGCSYAGKMALFCGAFDERIALTIAQEPGGGGVASWRASHELEGVEDLDHTDYHWWLESMRQQFGGDSVYRMPHDRHELAAMICPRALLMLGNTDYKWLADESAYVSINAVKRVWEQFGIANRVGYSIVGGHPHCMLPEEQYYEVEAFIDRFLLSRDSIDTNDIGIAPDFKNIVDLSKWINF